MIRSPADYMAEWESRPLDTKTTKQLVKHDPRRPMAARLKKKRVNHEPPLPMAARLTRRS